MGLREEFKKEWFVDMMNANSDLSPDQVTIYPLEDRETTDIERLVKVRRMWWHALDKDRILLAEFIELWCHVAPMAIENQEAVPADCSGSSLRLEHKLKPLESKLISRPAVLTDCNPPSCRQ
jgi:hypothetical protein